MSTTIPRNWPCCAESTGASVAGLDEVEINRAVASELKAILEGYGVVVELLPASIPPRYHADLVISLHADASSDPERRGYKSAHFTPARNRYEPELKRLVDRAYLAMSDMPDDDANVTGSMLHYYAFNHRRFRNSVRRGTPGLIVEMGYLSNADDLVFLDDPRRPATAIAEGIIAFLEWRGRTVGN